VLFDGAGADIQSSGDFFVAASLGEKAKNLLITGRDFDGVEIDHGVTPDNLRTHTIGARLSPNLRSCTRWDNH
jgi:predicted GNAT family acetyltransferase